MTRGTPTTRFGTISHLGTMPTCQATEDQTKRIFDAIRGDRSSEVLRLIADSDADSFCDQFENTPLLASAARGDERLVIELMRRGSSLNTQNVHGMTALMAAASFNKANIVRILHDAGARLDPTTKADGKDALGIATAKNAAAVTAYLRRLQTDTTSAEGAPEAPAAGWHTFKLAAFSGWATLALPVLLAVLLLLWCICRRRAGEARRDTTRRHQRPQSKASAGAAYSKRLKPPSPKSKLVGGGSAPVVGVSIRQGSPHRTSRLFVSTLSTASSSPETREPARNAPSMDPQPSKLVSSQSYTLQQMARDEAASEASQWRTVVRGRLYRDVGRCNESSAGPESSPSASRVDTGSHEHASSTSLSDPSGGTQNSRRVNTSSSGSHRDANSDQHYSSRSSESAVEPVAPPADIQTPEDGGDNEGAVGRAPTICRLSVSGLLCTGCKAKVEHALAALPAVSHVSVDLPSGECCLTMNGSLLIDTSELINAVRKLGLQCVPREEGGSPGPGGTPPLAVLVQRLQMLRQYPAEQTVRRFRCGCGCDGCICSHERLMRGDIGRDVTLGELCEQLESRISISDIDTAIPDPLDKSANPIPSTEALHGLRKRGRSSSKDLMTDTRLPAPTAARDDPSSQAVLTSVMHRRTPSFVVREWLGLEELLEGLLLPCACESTQVSPATTSSSTDSRMSPGGTSSYA